MSGITYPTVSPYFKQMDFLSMHIEYECESANLGEELRRVQVRLTLMGDLNS